MSQVVAKREKQILRQPRDAAGAVRRHPVWGAEAAADGAGIVAVGGFAHAVFQGDSRP